ncbi:hypothetical protein [Pontibacter harenae]|uniref:hypothetical protein n=1 Tax=Pontibacter harenae TaxID=2894083 RepID=UPI001E5FC3C8|nr:hypothetical protein [Pontibacter harenae]MCC9169056.1 hypothetical protein [Pontibacter harenae]
MLLKENEQLPLRHHIRCGRGGKLDFTKNDFQMAILYMVKGWCGNQNPLTTVIAQF